MNDPRKKNYADTRKAHPELVEEDCFLLPGGEAADLSGLTVEEHMAAWDDNRAIMHAIYEENENPEWKKLGAWETCYTERGCPEDLDAPPVRVLKWTPADIKKNEKLPALLFFPGSGLMLGGTADYAQETAMRIAMGCGVRMIVLISDYRLPPSFPYPAAINDCHAAYLWATEHAAELHINPNRIVISGGSSGGQMALGVGFRLKRYDYHGFMPRGIIPCVPVMDDISFNGSNTYPDLVEGRSAGWDIDANRSTAQAWLGKLFGDPALPPEAIPSRATLEDVKGYPPVWFPMCVEFDTPRDSCYRFAALLHQAGVFCDIHVWGGAGHMILLANGTNFSKRVQSVLNGAVRDAIKYDFRRPWLDEEC